MVSTRMRMNVRRLDRAATTSRVVNARSLQEEPMVCAQGHRGLRGWVTMPAVPHLETQCYQPGSMVALRRC